MYVSMSEPACMCARRVRATELEARLALCERRCSEEPPTTPQKRTIAEVREEAEAEAKAEAEAEAEADAAAEAEAEVAGEAEAEPEAAGVEAGPPGVHAVDETTKGTGDAGQGSKEEAVASSSVGSADGEAS